MPEVEGRTAFLAARDLGGSPEQVTTHWKTQSSIFARHQRDGVQEKKKKSQNSKVLKMSHFPVTDLKHAGEGE